MFRKLLTTFALLGALGLPGNAVAKIRVAASINDLASIASSVGGDEVEVFSIARSTADTHHIEVLPSYMVKVSRANVYLKVGLGLDQWADGIIDGSRNAHIKVVDCSKDVPLLEKPTQQVNASMGDVHPYGNPHYWPDPRNGAIVAQTIAEALASVDPKHAADYRDRADKFGKEAEETWKRGKMVAEEMPVKVMVTYHRSWTYFANAFGFEVAAEVVNIVKERHVPIFLQEPWFSSDAGNFLAREGGLRVVVASPSCDTPAAGSYLSHIGDLIAKIGGGKS